MKAFEVLTLIISSNMLLISLISLIVMLRRVMGTGTLTHH
ncbi:MAG: putative holin-like toxin [Natronincolaceae bacterium]|jgi:hypothetical protein